MINSNSNSNLNSNPNPPHHPPPKPPIKSKKYIDKLISSIDNEFISNNFKPHDYVNPTIPTTKMILPPQELTHLIEPEHIIKNIYSACISSYSACTSYSACLVEQSKYILPASEINCNKSKIHKILINLDIDINNLDDLIKMIDDYPFDETKQYNINMDKLYKIKPHLIELNTMIGMKDLKNNIVDQILYFIQDFHKSGDFMHTVIYGPPGTGKTELAKIIGQIYCKLGILKKGTFKKVTRSDLIAGYLGQTAIKTRDVINECLGGVLFIDEAYSLGNTEKNDIFSKECIDTLCEALSNHKEELMVIITGYETELNECFFNYNQGLDSRFTWRFKTDEYKGEELYNIFLKKVNDCKWTIDIISDTKISKDWFEKNIGYFKFFGRDIETLLAKIKIVHGRRIFCKYKEEKMKITIKDLEKGFELYKKNNEVKKRKDNNNKLLTSMYI